MGMKECGVGVTAVFALNNWKDRAVHQERGPQENKIYRPGGRETEGDQEVSFGHVRFEIIISGHVQLSPYLSTCLIKKDFDP